MPKILIVDDTAVDRRLAGGLLSQDPSLEIAYAESVPDAMDQISGNPPDIVVTDLQMPEFDGLDLVNRINETRTDIPVVLITAHGSENIAAQALASGAASYVPKSELSHSLFETVMYVLSLSDSESSNQRLMSCIRNSEMEFELDNDLSLIEPLVDMTQDILGCLDLFDQRSKVQLCVALENGLTNAMCRGNLEMSREQWPVLSKTIVESRASQDPFCQRKVHFRVKANAEKVEFCIRDEGQGFDTATLPDTSDPDSFRDGIGRGLVLIQAFMDEVSFNDSGRELTMLKYPALAAAQPASS